MKWIEAFRDVLHACIGAWMTPLSYVIREVVAPDPIGPRAQNAPHSADHGSVKRDLIMYTSHDHPSYDSDNSAVYGMIEVACRGTIYAATIKPFQRTSNGRAAFLSIVSQYAGTDKWKLEIQNNDSFLHSCLLYTSPSPRDGATSRMPSSA